MIVYFSRAEKGPGPVNARSAIKTRWSGPRKFGKFGYNILRLHARGCWLLFPVTQSLGRTLRTLFLTLGIATRPQSCLGLFHKTIHACRHHLETSQPQPRCRRSSTTTSVSGTRHESISRQPDTPPSPECCSLPPVQAEYTPKGKQEVRRSRLERSPMPTFT